jgi:hypothetical protein
MAVPALALRQSSAHAGAPRISPGAQALPAVPARRVNNPSPHSVHSSAGDEDEPVYVQTTNLRDRLFAFFKRHDPENLAAINTLLSACNQGNDAAATAEVLEGLARQYSNPVPPVVFRVAARRLSQPRVEGGPGSALSGADERVLTIAGTVAQTATTSNLSAAPTATAPDRSNEDAVSHVFGSAVHAVSSGTAQSLDSPSITHVHTIDGAIDPPSNSTASPRLALVRSYTHAGTTTAVNTTSSEIRPIVITGQRAEGAFARSDPWPRVPGMISTVSDRAFQIHPASSALTAGANASGIAPAQTAAQLPHPVATPPLTLHQVEADPVDLEEEPTALVQNSAPGSPRAATDNPVISLDMVSPIATPAEFADATHAHQLPAAEEVTTAASSVSLPPHEAGGELHCTDISIDDVIIPSVHVGEGHCGTTQNLVGQSDLVGAAEDAVTAALSVTAQADHVPEIREVDEAVALPLTAIEESQSEFTQVVTAEQIDRMPTPTLHVSPWQAVEVVMDSSPGHVGSERAGTGCIQNDTRSSPANFHEDVAPRHSAVVSTGVAPLSSEPAADAAPSSERPTEPLGDHAPAHTADSDGNPSLHAEALPASPPESEDEVAAGAGEQTHSVNTRQAPRKSKKGKKGRKGK